MGAFSVDVYLHGFLVLIHHNRTGSPLLQHNTGGRCFLRDRSKDPLDSTDTQQPIVEMFWHSTH
jgi:hypothetical protein